MIGERWSLLIVRDVMNGNRRFSGIQASLGIARNVLTDRLGRLGRGRTSSNACEYQDRPFRYEYELTTTGHDLTVPP